MYCLNCGAQMTEGARFCQKCGADMQAMGAQPTQAMGAQPTQAMGAQPTQAMGAQPTQAMGQQGAQGYAPADPTQAMGHGAPYRQTTDAGYENDPYNPYYYGEPMDEREAKRMANAQVKEAKAAYNDARRAAGKSNAPKVIGIIVALLVVAGIAAGVTWWLMGNNANGAAAGSSSSSSVASSEAAASESSEAASTEASAAASAASSTAEPAASSAAASSSSAASGLASYVGTWKGKFEQQTDYSGHHCYGAEQVELELTITDVSNSGRVLAEMKALFHSHGKVDQHDVEKSDGDVVLELKGLVSTIDSNGRFEFVADAPDGQGEITVRVETVDKPDGTRTLAATVKSFEPKGTFIDAYSLTKQ